MSFWRSCTSRMRSRLSREPGDHRSFTAARIGQQSCDAQPRHKDRDRHTRAHADRTASLPAPSLLSRRQGEEGSARPGRDRGRAIGKLVIVMIDPFDLWKEIQRGDWRGGPARRKTVAFARLSQIAVQICSRRGNISQSFSDFRAGFVQVDSVRETDIPLRRFRHLVHDFANGPATKSHKIVAVRPVGHPSRKLGILNARLLGTGSSPARFLGRRRGRLALVFTPGASPGNRQTKFTCQRAGSRGFRIGDILTLGELQDLSVESAAGALSPRHECRGTSRFLVASSQPEKSPSTPARLHRLQRRGRPRFCTSRGSCVAAVPLDTATLAMTGQTLTVDGGYVMR
jgi:hypothetical protein